jgi:hypothetical protein
MEQAETCGSGAHAERRLPICRLETLLRDIGCAQA